jgi:hypothetical protein
MGCFFVAVSTAATSRLFGFCWWVLVGVLQFDACAWEGGERCAIMLVMKMTN